MAKSNRTSARRKPAFPLRLHSTGQWCKKITPVNGVPKVFYFGRDRDAALERYTREKDDLRAGRTPKPYVVDKSGLTLVTLVNAFLTCKKHDTDIGALSRRTFQDYHRTCELLLEHFGNNQVVEAIAPTDLSAYHSKLSKTRGVIALGNEVVRVRTVLIFASEQSLIDKPIKFGYFAKPAKAAYRRARDAGPDRMFQPAQLRTILAKADPHMRAMVLLGLNAGFGNSDVGQLPQRAIDWAGGWIDFPRPKTGIARRVPLWAETVRALKKSIALRQTPKNPDDDRLCFLTKYGKPWHRDDDRSSPLSAEFRKLLVSLGLYRAGLSFYSLRHVFATVGSETCDEIAVKRIMGHVDGSMLDVYRERFPDERLQRVVDHVRAWLLSDTTEEELRALEGGAQ